MRKYKADKIFYEIPGYVRYFHRIWHFTQNSSMLSYDNKLYIDSYHTVQAADDDRGFLTWLSLAQHDLHRKYLFQDFSSLIPLPSVRKFRIISNGSGILYLKPKVGEFKSVDIIF